jgi:hypothetical protein
MNWKFGSSLIVIGLVLCIFGLGLYVGNLQCQCSEPSREIVIVPDNSIPRPTYTLQNPPVSYDLAVLDNAILEIDAINPSNGTNCLPRAIALQSLLTDYGINSTIKMGATEDLLTAHAWIVVNNLEIFGRTASYPIPYGAGYYEIVNLTGE